MITLILSAIPTRVRLYALLALVFVLALLRWRSVAVDAALEDERQRRQAATQAAVETALEVQEDVQGSSDDELRDRASRWVRGNTRR